MDLLANLSLIEVIGWLASILTVASYSVSTMLPLRTLAISSSICFALYSFSNQLWPLLVMELILLPINMYRFWEVLSLRRKVGRASAAQLMDFALIKTYGKRLIFDQGSVVFKKGDKADNLYFIAAGRILIEELGIELSDGEIFGEIAFFTHSQSRMASARCVSAAEVYALSEKQLMRLQFEDPSFGMAIMRTITQRLIDPERKYPLAAEGSAPSLPA
jgi:CRP/FNR family cyclic AMP-dependent transcriptional regulator